MLTSLISTLSLLSLTCAIIPSPAASADIICHTTNLAECYPREFVPTNKFQVVRDDQSIPKGLHVRLNLATGVKEAKINVLDLNDSEQHYSDLAVEVPVPEVKEQRSDIIVVEEIEEQPSPPSMHDQPAPEQQHPIRPSPFHPGEHSLFTESISILKSSSPKDDPKFQLLALSDLQDLSHSHHWGVTLTRDRATSHKIFQLLSASSPSIEIRSAAALLLGTAVHNNPDALTAALTHFYTDEWPTGPLEAVLVALMHESLPKFLQRMVFLLSGLCQDPNQLSKFVDAGGLETMLGIFDKESVNRNSDGKLQGKVANFLLDHFLQLDEVTVPLSENKLDEIILPESGEDDQEVDSKLEGEAPWVLTQEEQDQDDLPDDANVQFGRNMARALQPWCSAFEKFIRAGTRTGSDEIAISARASIKEARCALERALEANGCNCDEDCSSSVD